VKLGKNANDTCAMLSKAYMGEAMKSVSEWHKLFKESHMSKSQMKAMLIIFFDINGIIHFEFIPQDQTDNQAYYVEILKSLCEAVHRKRPELQAIDWILHCDNVPAHSVLSIK
jgi:hypothetical protein